MMSCAHETCQDCMRLHFTSQIDQDKALSCPMKCPLNVDLAHLEIKAVLDKETFLKYEKFLNQKQIDGLENMRFCAWGCGNGWIWEFKNQTKKRCTTCEKYTCLSCNEKWHDNDGLDMTCEQYQLWKKENAMGDDQFEKLIKSGEAMRCPKCGVPCQKDDGCDWMACTKCQTELCWATRGPRWGPKGHGDKSGGCKCLSDGRTRCSPTCQGCH